MPRKPSRSRSAPSKHAGLPLAAKDSPSAADARKRARRAEREDARYLAWVRTLPCAVGEGCSGVVAPHHEPPVSHAGDWHDRSTVPLCARHHTQRHHVLGLRLFQEKYAICLLAFALELRGRYLQENA